MSSSKASYMFVALILLVLVLADMDKALGEQIQLRNRKLSRLIPKGWFSANQKKLPAWMKKGQDLMGAIPPPPPSPLCNINDDVCKRKLKKAYDLLKAKSLHRLKGLPKAKTYDSTNFLMKKYFHKLSP